MEHETASGEPLYEQAPVLKMVHIDKSLNRPLVTAVAIFSNVIVSTLHLCLILYLLSYYQVAEHTTMEWHQVSIIPFSGLVKCLQHGCGQKWESELPWFVPIAYSHLLLGMKIKGQNCSKLVATTEGFCQCPTT